MVNMQKNADPFTQGGTKVSVCSINLPHAAKHILPPGKVFCSAGIA
jgi:hypothetical protein